MTESVGLDDAISSQVRRYRLAKNWSVRQLAEECQRLGMASLTEASVGNIERGQKAGSGAKRGIRRVLVEELTVLAKALEVPPILLVFPVDTAPTIEVAPGQVMPTWDALRWFTAEGPMNPDGTDRAFGPGQYDPAAPDQLGYGKQDPATGLYEWYEPAEAAWEQSAAPVLLLRQLGGQVRHWLDTAPRSDDEQRRAMLATIRATLAEMRRRGMPAPALPEGLTNINHPGKGGSERGRSDQEG